ncbi:MAG TPA: response regulator [Verrucomicrobiae bacterium]|jgi:CheY-like chemotaxis protein|nr:response regulator [Verrucomicrobiae bacterium]
MVKKILYVDDEVESRIMVADYLRYLGHEIITVEEAGQALRAALDNQVAAVILDVNLVGLDGPELLALLRRNHPAVPIILYSGMNPEAEKVKRMMAGGANRFLSKNEPLEELVKVLHGVLN